MTILLENQLLYNDVDRRNRAGRRLFDGILDGLLHFYSDYHFENDFSRNFLERFPYEKIKGMLYFSEWTEEISDYYKDAKYHGNTATFPGFYAPQGRQLRLKALDEKFLETLISNILLNKNC